MPNSRTLTSYSGADIVSVFRFPDFMNIKPMVFAELKTVSYSTYRDKFPVRALGHVKPKGYTKGSRTVAGSMIFSVFDKTIINKMLDTAVNNNGKPIYDSKNINILPDEIPPFDIDITMANEAGYQTKISIIGAEFTESNQVMSIEQIKTDEQYSFVAQGLITLDIDNKNFNSNDSNNDPGIDLEKDYNNYDYWFASNESSNDLPSQTDKISTIESKDKVDSSVLETKLAQRIGMNG